MSLGPSEPVIAGDVMDVGDMGQDYQSRLNLASVGLVVAEARHQAGPGSEICVDCGDEIPPGRREVQQGCIRCAECQTLFERLRRGI